MPTPPDSTEAPVTAPKTATASRVSRAANPLDSTEAPIKAPPTATSIGTKRAAETFDGSRHHREARRYLVDSTLPRARDERPAVASAAHAALAPVAVGPATSGPGAPQPSMHVNAPPRSS